MNVLVQLAAALAMAYIKWWVGREDIKKAERQRLLIDQLELENAALTWLAEARLDPARWSKLRVHLGASSLESFHVSTTPTSSAPPGDLPTEGRKL